MNRRPGRYARTARRIALVAFAVSIAASVIVALTGAPNSVLRANAATITGLAILLLVTTAIDRALNKPTDREQQPRAYRHHDHNHDDQ